jgi:hypothetical protein
MMNEMKDEIKESMNANIKADQEHMQDMLDKMDAIRKDDQEEINEEFLASLEDNTDAN